MANELTAKGFVKKLVGFSMASWISAFISFAITPIFTRLFLPEQVGHINLFTTYMTFFQTVCVLALDQTFMRFYNEELEGIRKDNFLTYCLKINLCISGISMVCILGGYTFFSTQIAGRKDLVIAVCLVISIVCSTFLRMSSISSRMKKNTILYTFQVLAVTFVDKVLVTLIGFYRPNHKFAIIGMTIGYVVIAVVFFWIKRQDLKMISKVPRTTTIMLLKYALPYLPVLVLAWLNSSIPLLVLKKYVDFSAIGIYTNAVTLANVLSIVQTGFSAYWEPFFYQYYKEETAKEKIIKIQKMVIFGILVIAIGIVLFQDILYLFIGEKYRVSKAFFPFLMMTPICSLIADMTGIGIKLSKKNYLNIYVFISNVVVNLGISYVLVPKIGVAGAGIAVACSALVMLTVRTIFGCKYYKISENNKFIVASMSVMTGVTLANMLIKTDLIRYIVLSGFLLGLCIIYKETLKWLLIFFKRSVLGKRSEK